MDEIIHPCQCHPHRRLVFLFLILNITHRNKRIDFSLMHYGGSRMRKLSSKNLHVEPSYSTILNVRSCFLLYVPCLGSSAPTPATSRMNCCIFVDSTWSFRMRWWSPCSPKRSNTFLTVVDSLVAQMSRDFCVIFGWNMAFCRISNPNRWTNACRGHCTYLRFERWPSFSQV